MEGIEVTGLPQFDKLLSVDEIEDMAGRATAAGAFTLVEYIKNSLIKKLPKATQRNPKFTDTIADAVRFSRMKAFSNKRMVHALGTREKGSGTYRAAFFENTTQRRYQKTYRGQALKKKRFLGVIEGTGFFQTGVSEGGMDAVNAMKNSVENYIKNIKL